jgi:hypothetical protein
MGDEMDGAMQQAPQPARQFIARVCTGRDFGAPAPYNPGLLKK